MKIPRQMRKRLFMLALAVLLLPAVANTQPGSETIKPGNYKIKILNPDNTIWCLDRTPDDPNHQRLAFSTCNTNHPETEIFTVVITAGASDCNQSCQIRPKPDNVSSGTNYHLLAVEEGPSNPHDGDWTPIASLLCSNNGGGSCSQDRLTWRIQPWGNGTFKILSNKIVQGYPHGWCVNKRSQGGGPQFLDCRGVPTADEFIFQSVP